MLTDTPEIRTLPRYESIPMVEARTGMSAADISGNIERGVWAENREWLLIDGEKRIDMEGLVRWVTGDPPIVRPPQTPPRESLRTAARARRDKPTALYRHFDAESRLLYVGVSFTPLVRLTQHRDKAHWVQSITRVEMEWHPSRDKALQAESQAIRSEKPLHNIAGR